MKKIITIGGASLVLAIGTSNIAWAVENQDEAVVGEKMIITTAHKLFPNTTKATTSFEVSAEDLKKTNVTSAEDAIRMAPSVHVRRRFYGDTNGVTAIRGSTNFQTNHFNLFVDGLPLHNPVQTKWNGGPKWNLIAPNAIHSTTVFYGPYSAEHKGSFGGTFDIKTKMPEKFEMHLDVTGFLQDSHRLGQSELLWGHKEFISAGNKFGDWSIFAFYNHLENEGQAQSFVTRSGSQLTENAGPQTGFGSQLTTNIDGEQTIITGDDGPNENLTDLYELKVGYDFNDDLRALFTIAFEDTERERQSRSYVEDGNGTTLWGGSVVENDQEFLVNPTRFGRPALNGSENERKTLAYGLNLSGQLNEDWSIDTTASFFDAFKDVTLQSTHSRHNPEYQNNKSGRITENEIWWVDYSVKLATQNLFGRDDLGFLAGYQYNYSYLDVDQWNSDDVYSGSKTTQRSSNGGSTQTHSAFMQADWDINEYFNILGGLRYDHWSSFRGHTTTGFPSSLEHHPDRDASRWSPKASLTFTPTDLLSFKYSFTKAYRFPVAEELFENTSSGNSNSISDPGLVPESGYFHDLSAQFELPEGYIRATVFYNEIENEILRTLTLEDDGVTTTNFTRGIDETETIGIELVYVQDYIFDLPIGLNLNGTWINKEVKKDDNNPDNVGNSWPRIPQYRANGTLTYHVTQNWDTNVAVQYRSKQFGQDDNSDRHYHVFGASDEYVLVNFKTAYTVDIREDVAATFSVGVDNILDEDYYDHHPYPQRTYFANVSMDIK